MWVALGLIEGGWSERNWPATSRNVVSMMMGWAQRSVYVSHFRVFVHLLIWFCQVWSVLFISKWMGAHPLEVSCSFNYTPYVKRISLVRYSNFLRERSCVQYWIMKFLISSRAKFKSNESQWIQAKFHSNESQRIQAKFKSNESQPVQAKFKSLIDWLIDWLIEMPLFEIQSLEFPMNMG